MLSHSDCPHVGHEVRVLGRVRLEPFLLRVLRLAFAPGFRAARLEPEATLSPWEDIRAEVRLARPEELRAGIHSELDAFLVKQRRIHLQESTAASATARGRALFRIAAGDRFLVRGVLVAPDRILVRDAIPADTWEPSPSQRMRTATLRGLS